MSYGLCLLLLVLARRSFNIVDKLVDLWLGRARYRFARRHRLRGSRTCQSNLLSRRIGSRNSG